MKSFKTKLGTEIPIMDLKGKDYIQVAHRVVWFREEHPKGLISTSMIKLETDYAIFKSEICVDDTILSTAHGREDSKHFIDFIEKAETKAIGRALALCGYGTAHAPEFDEKERIVDSPLGKSHSTNKEHGGAQNTAGSERQSLDRSIHKIVEEKQIPHDVVKDIIHFRYAPKRALAELTHDQATALFAELSTV